MMSRVLLKFKRHNVLLPLMVFLILYAMMPSPGYAKEKSVNVLILNSYHQGLEWTDDQTQGILDNLQLPYEQSIYIEYLPDP